MLSLLRRPRPDPSTPARGADGTYDSTTVASLLSGRTDTATPIVVTFSITAAVAPRGSALVLVDQIVVQRLEVAESTETASVELAPLAIGRHTAQVVFIGAKGFAHSSSYPLNLKVTGSPTSVI